MKKFFTAVLASALGTFFAITLSFTLITFLIISTLLFTGQKIQNDFNQSAHKVEKNKPSVLKITLTGNIIERSSTQKQILNILEQKDTIHTLSSLTTLINMAKKNKKIKGIYLKVQNFDASWSVLKQLQKQLMNFKKSGKFIIAFAESLSEKKYLLASTATKIVLYPEGHIEWNGFHAQFTSIKELLEKVKIQIYVFRTGKFKSAVEPLLNKTISSENKLQIKNLISKMWNYLLNEISRPNVNKNVLNHLAEKYLYLSPEEALKYNLIDNIGTEWAAFSIINKNLKVKNLSSLPTFYNGNTNKNNSFQTFVTNINDLNKAETQFGSKECMASNKKKKKICNKSKIAILYLNGEIQDGNALEDKIGSLNTIKVLRDIKKNKHIKALVIRINSPGGSALASDVIWNEIKILKKTMPVVTSVSSMAASGGYYLAASSNFIFAEPHSIIGSIGVFFVRPYTAKLTESLGVYNQNISTHNNVKLFNTNELLSPLEQDRINVMLKKTYNKFKHIIKKGRNLSEEKVNELATGRYWLGEQSLKLGLVDKIGNLKEAINKAASLAKVKIYSTTNYPLTSPLDFNLIFSIQNFLKNTLLEPLSLFFINFKTISALQKVNFPIKNLPNIHQLDPKGILLLMPDQISYN